VQFRKFLINIESWERDARGPRPWPIWPMRKSVSDDDVMNYVITALQ